MSQHSLVHCLVASKKAQAGVLPPHLVYGIAPMIIRFQNSWYQIKSLVFDGI